jgi:hypothetical protein
MSKPITIMLRPARAPASTNAPRQRVADGAVIASGALLAFCFENDRLLIRNVCSH